MLPDVTKCQGNSCYRFWIVTGIPTGGQNYPSPQTPTQILGLNYQFPFFVFACYAHIWMVCTTFVSFGHLDYNYFDNTFWWLSKFSGKSEKFHKFHRIIVKSSRNENLISTGKISWKTEYEISLKCTISYEK